MKKHPYLFLFIVLLIVIPFIARYKWNKRSERFLNILVVDKTVLDGNRQEHIPLFWIIEHDKYVKGNGLQYKPDKDYFGLLPDEKGNFEVNDFSDFSDSALNILANKFDVAYYTDMYGVYAGEWYERY